MAASGADAVYFAGGSDRFVLGLFRRLSHMRPDLPLVTPDAFLGFFGPAQLAGRPLGMYTTGAFLVDPQNQLPPEGRRFVREFSATQPGRAINAFVPYAAQATEVLLDAIGRSDGSRASVIRELFATRVEDGILGSFTFDANGDITPATIPVFRIEQDPDSGGRVYRLFEVLEVPSELTAG